MTKLLSFFILSVVALAFIFPKIGAETVIPDPTTKEFNRTLFPEGFMFGTATASYQIEGAARTNGKLPSIWDKFVENPKRIKDQKTADVADDFYHRYKEWIPLGFPFHGPEYYQGKLSGGINHEGVKFYNDVIDELLANGIKPFVTLFHFDTPQALEDEYDGFLSPKIVNDYRDFADLCFKWFGDRVKFWLTFNEPSTFMVYGYTSGLAAPGRCSKRLNPLCNEGDSYREPYLAAHNILLSHATAVKLYREKYQATQNGQIGITLVTYDFIPNNTESSDDKAAAKRIQDFVLRWFLNTITYGDYPAVMRSLVSDRLPKFTPAESQMLKGSKDFLGFNYYSGRYATKQPLPKIDFIPSYLNDSDVKASAYKNGKDGEAIVNATGIDWIFEYPQGFEKVLMYIKDNYENPVIYITENGYPEKDNGTLSRENELKDFSRVTYFQQHLKYLLSAIKNGVNVKGYYAWSFTDNFEWDSGYIPRFGIVYVDYKDQLKRTLKASATWFQEFLLQGQ